jgi:DNA-binding MarR family transcriptional regulator
MANDRLDEVIELLLRIPPIMHRKVHKEVFRAALEQVGGDIAPHHLMIMKVLQQSATLHSSEIAEKIAITKPQMTHSIDKLISLGMVSRWSDTEDRRKINIRLTQKGRDTMERIDEILRAGVKARLSTLSDDQLKKLAESFQYIAQTFSKLQ